MPYRMNPEAWGAMFPVPAQIVDKHIRLANGEQLKVLLWILRHAPENPEISTLCQDLKMQPDDVKDYLQYWILTGVLLDTDSPTPQTHLPAPATVAAVPEPPAPKQLPELPETKPSSEQIAARAQESSEIQFLFSQAQCKLGRTIGYDGQCTLLLMHDQYGLPVEVILMILEYAVSVQKTNMHYIAALGKNWGEREIDTLEKADAQITKLRQSNRLWTAFAAMAGIANPRPTAKQTEYLQQWQNWGFGEDMIFLAYERMANQLSKLSFPYMHKILLRWHEEGCKTPADVEAQEKEKKTGTKESAAKKSSASYDLDKFRQTALNIPSAYKKKGKP